MLAKRRALDKLHREKRPALMLSHIVDRADIGMSKLGNSTRFALEAQAQIGFLRQAFREHFDGDGAVQARIVSTINFAHAALCQEPEDAKPACQKLPWPESITGQFGIESPVNIRRSGKKTAGIIGFR